MAWRIEFAPDAAKELRRLDRPVARRILDFLDNRLGALDDPRSIGQPLRGPELGDFWKYRVGDYRIIAEIEDGVMRVLVLRVAHRRAVYRRSK
ncbi:type II toxin-antitoxin system RelE family toxin [Aquibaculum arenosum]|uniref:Type II toxin-antitoxin system RelE/ParE family toxin n=1 Tax=Aquibaculum arenosum TaxID=3032591 RepID=A0ABT5YQQ1_9PROT|nr:type II toxin-antitoxin system RelE/ParE family toxin [Fodinicurvata sp. CAU 1616]MDF2097307.1 type II toxin-antitoxin system RelE/ParE family toxin [Fodinicurvata sp. CAU 1616]